MKEITLELTDEEVAALQVNNFTDVDMPLLLKISGKIIDATREDEPEPEPRTDYMRKELIEICEKAIVPMDEWSDRDSYSAQVQLAEAWMLLLAGAPFEILTTSSLKTDNRTIWVNFSGIKGFDYFEQGDKYEALCYLPTPARLEETGYGDWY